MRRYRDIRIETENDGAMAEALEEAMAMQEEPAMEAAPVFGEEFDDAYTEI